MNTIGSLVAEIRDILSEKTIQDVKVLDWQKSILKVRLYLADDRLSRSTVMTEATIPVLP